MPLLWFQETDEHETPRQRFHLDVWVAPEVTINASLRRSRPAGRPSTTATPRGPR
jgi:hypothetical protein